MIILRGSQAHAHFRIERLLAQLTYIVPEVTSLQSQWIHFIDTFQKESSETFKEKEQEREQEKESSETFKEKEQEREQEKEQEREQEKEQEREQEQEQEQEQEKENYTLTENELVILNQLLDYGTPLEKEWLSTPHYTEIIVLPQQGVVSPWSVCATEIAHLCGLKNVKRIERGIVFYILSHNKLTWGDIQALASELYDPTTEQIAYHLDAIDTLQTVQTVHAIQIPQTIQILNLGKHALIEFNEQHQLGLSESKIDLLYNSFLSIKRDPFDIEAYMFSKLSPEYFRTIFTEQSTIKETQKNPLQPGMLIAVLGGHCQEVIDICNVVSTHTVGESGLANAIAEFIYPDDKGAYIELSKIPTEGRSLSWLQILCNESEVSLTIAYIIALLPSDLPRFEEITKREGCLFAVIGKVVSEPVLQVFDDKHNQFVVDFPLEILKDFVHKGHDKVQEVQDSKENNPNDFSWNYKEYDIYETCFRLLRQPSIADKSFLLSFYDRTMTGLIARDSFVGPWQVPVADCKVSARSFDSIYGDAVSTGSRDTIASIDAGTGIRMAIGEAITNIAAANIESFSDIKIAINASDLPIIFEEQVTFDPKMISDFKVTSDSKVTSDINVNFDPNTALAVRATAPVIDIRKTLTPVMTNNKNTRLIFIDLSQGQERLGGSAFAQVFNQLQVRMPVPDVDDPDILRVYFDILQFLNNQNKILAYHDRSNGGLFITLCELAFASHVGIYADISDLGENPHTILFNEELGSVLQVRSEDVDYVINLFLERGIHRCFTMGVLDDSQALTIVFQEEAVFYQDRITLQKAWSETSFNMQSLRFNPRTAKKQFESIEDVTDPGLNSSLTYNFKEKIIEKFTSSKDKRPKIAILREKGVIGYKEMAFAFEQALFSPVDVHMNDLGNFGNSGNYGNSGDSGNFLDLSEFKGLAVCGGFSFEDVLGAGLGWAKRILFNPYLLEIFQTFFNRPDTFTLGIGNGCQMLSALKTIIPGAEAWPSFSRNLSSQFESRWCMVEVQESPSLFFKDMIGSILMVPVLHEEGRVQFANEEIQDRALKQGLVTLRYVDSRHRKTKVFPANPNGSPLGITGLTTVDGRVSIMMPHPERAFRVVQHSWCPKEWYEVKDGIAPWFRFFQNARRWVD